MCDACTRVQLLGQHDRTRDDLRDVTCAGLLARTDNVSCGRGVGRVAVGRFHVQRTRPGWGRDVRWAYYLSETTPEKFLNTRKSEIQLVASAPRPPAAPRRRPRARRPRPPRGRARRRPAPRAAESRLPPPMPTVHVAFARTSVSKLTHMRGDSNAHTHESQGTRPQTTPGLTHVNGLPS